MAPRSPPGLPVASVACAKIRLWALGTLWWAVRRPSGGLSAWREGKGEGEWKGEEADRARRLGRGEVFVSAAFYAQYVLQPRSMVFIRTSSPLAVQKMSHVCC